MMDKTMEMYITYKMYMDVIGTGIGIAFLFFVAFMAIFNNKKK